MAPPVTTAPVAATPADPIPDFFAGLTAPGHLATFEGQSATLRFDVTEGGKTEHWRIVVDDGRVEASQSAEAADAVIMVSRPHFAAMVTGRLNAQAAILRGLLSCSGSMAALMMFQRCLPGPPGSTGHVPPISAETVMAARRPQ